jgi:predicted Zn-dependent peptidase
VTRARLSIITGLLVAVLSGSVAAQQPPQAPDRTHPPAVGPAPTLRVPPVERRTLSNGLPVWIVEAHDVPVVQVELAVRAGSAADPPEKFGLASLTADMLDEGAGTRNALELADAVDFLGASLNTGSSFDASTVTLHVPAARLADALPLMADVVLHPTFPEKELQRIREEDLTQLIQAQDDPEALVRIAFPRLVYGATHRYGTPSIGTAASLRGFTVDDLKRFHGAMYRPSNAVLIVVGDVTAAAAVPLVEHAFGAWPKAAVPEATALPAAPQLRARHVYLIDKPGAAQSQIQIGWIGVPRSTPDYFALRVLNTILGGAFTSRLNTNLREEHGYAYGAGSAFDMRVGAGPFYAAAGVQTDKTAEALTEFFNELRRIHDPIDDAELKKAKNYLALLLPRSFETTRSIAASLAQIYVYDLPADFYATYAARVEAVTSADLKRAADKYIQPDKFAVVVVGDRQKIEAGIKALNLGPVTIVTPDQVMK